MFQLVRVSDITKPREIQFIRLAFFQIARFQIVSAWFFLSHFSIFLWLLLFWCHFFLLVFQILPLQTCFFPFFSFFAFFSFVLFGAFLVPSFYLCAFQSFWFSRCCLTGLFATFLSTILEIRGKWEFFCGAVDGSDSFQKRSRVSLGLF